MNNTTEVSLFVFVIWSLLFSVALIFLLMINFAINFIIDVYCDFMIRRTNKVWEFRRTLFDIMEIEILNRHILAEAYPTIKWYNPPFMIYEMPSFHKMRWSFKSLNGYNFFDKESRIKLSALLEHLPESYLTQYNDLIKFKQAFRIKLYRKEGFYAYPIIPKGISYPDFPPFKMTY